MLFNFAFMEPRYKKVLFFVFRFCIYFAAMVALNLVFMYDASHETATAKFGEISMTETIQPIILLIISFGFVWFGRKVKSMAFFSYLASLFFFMSFIREFNEYLEHWFYFVLPFFIASVYLLIRYFRKIVDGLSIFIGTISSAIFLIGFLITYVFSRFFGRATFWKTLMEDGYMRMVKATAEEGTELLGYTIMLIAMIELLVVIPKLIEKLEN